MEDGVIIKSDLHYVPSKWSMCKFSIKSCKTLMEIWDQFAQIYSNFAKKTPS